MVAKDVMEVNKVSIDSFSNTIPKEDTLGTGTG